MSTTKVLVRRPARRLADGIVTNIERKPVDYDLAAKQWEQYVSALESAAWDVVEVPPAEDCPDSVFVEDAVVIFRNVAVLTSPGAPSRRDEIPGVEPVVSSLGCSVNRIELPGTLDGGDVLKVGDTVYVGRGGRTNGEGIAQLRSIIAPLGAVVVPVPVKKVLHLKSAVTALPDGTVIGYRPLVDEPGVFGRFLPVPEESGAHVVVLDDETVLMAGDCRESAGLFSDLGYRTVTVDIGEFQALEGCVTCLSVRMRELAS
ncbi:MAG: dimethylargininase [Acidimicrobiales bacterium]